MVSFESAPLSASTFEGAKTGILDLITDRIFVKNVDGQYVYMNRACAQAYGLDIEDGLDPLTDDDFFTDRRNVDADIVERQVRATREESVDQEEEEHWVDGREPGWVRVSRYPVALEDGSIGILGIARDITKEIEQREELERRLAAESAHDGLIVRDAGRPSFWCSPRLKQLLGYKEHEISNKLRDWRRLIHPADRERVRSEFSSVMQDGKKVFETVYRLLHKDSRYRWVRLRWRAERDDGGRIHRFVGSHTDITDHVKKEMFLEHLLDAAPCYIFVKDEDGKFVWVNKPLMKVLRARSREEVIGKSDSDFIGSLELIEQFAVDDKEARAGGRVEREEHLLVDGNKRNLATIKVQLPQLLGQHGSVYVLGTSIDVTEFQSKLKLERQRFNTLMSHVPDAIYLKDRDGRFVFVNESMAKIMGVSAHKAIGKRHEEVFEFDPEHAQLAAEDESKIVETAEPVIGAERWHKTASGRQRRSLTDKVPIFDRSGNVKLIAVVSRDVTPLYEKEQEIERQRQLLHRIIDTLPQSIFVKDRVGKYMECNTSFRKRHGVADRRAIIGQTDFSLWPEGDAERFRKDDWCVIRSGEPKLRFREKWKDRIIETSKIPLHDGEGRVTGLLGIYDDITDKLEEEKADLHRAITRTLSHCLKGWVSVLEGNCFALELELEKGIDAEIVTPARKTLMRLQQSIGFLKEAAMTATNVAALANDIPLRDDIELGDLAKKLIESICDERVELRPPEDEVRVAGSAFHLRNALIEVVNNAKDFTPNTENGGCIQVWVEAAGDVGKIHIRDNGPGVPPRLRGKVFDLFATDGENRTGMGLHYVKRVMEQHKGAAEVLGEEGKGAHFVLTIPLDRRR